MARIVGKIVQDDSTDKWFVDFGDLQKVGPFNDVEEAKKALRARAYKLRPRLKPPRQSEAGESTPVITARTRKRRNCKNC